MPKAQEENWSLRVPPDTLPTLKLGSALQSHTAGRTELPEGQFIGEVDLTGSAGRSKPAAIQGSASQKPIRHLY